MFARLTVLSGAKTSQVSLHLPTIVGRGGGSKLKLPSAVVSRQHCEIYDYEGQIAVRDLGSSNGTIVNGHRIQGPTFISPQDEVTIGPVKFQVAIQNETIELATAQPEESATTAAAEEAKAIPSFEELPPDTSTPQQVDSELPSVEVPSGDEEGSVLQYTKPQDDGDRSFVGIVSEETVPEPESTAPAFEAQGEPSSNAVEGDDSSLQNFFNKLDG